MATVAVLCVFHADGSSTRIYIDLRQRRHRKEQECCGCVSSPTPAQAIPLTSTTFICPSADGARINFVVSGDDDLIEFGLSKSDNCVLCCRSHWTGLPPNRLVVHTMVTIGKPRQEILLQAYTLLAVAHRIWPILTAVLPRLVEQSYQLTSFDAPQLYAGQWDEIARFLQQATFGPTRADINACGASTNLQSSSANWIRTRKTSVPVTSHRALLGKRVNARMEHASSLGAVTHPCQAGTRYRRYAFPIKDRLKHFEIRTVGTKKILSIYGFVRTVVERPVAWYLNDSAIYEDGRYVQYGSRW
jgi:hypothetical protein